MNYCSGYFIGCFRIRWFWNIYHLISISLIDSLLILIYMLFLSIWLFIACMLLAVLQEFITSYDCEIYLDLYMFFFIWIIVVCMFLAVLREVIALNICQIIIILYEVIDWFFNCFDLHFVTFHLNYCGKYVCCCFTRSGYFR